MKRRRFHTCGYAACPRKKLFFGVFYFMIRDKYYMRRALLLAKRGKNRTFPNPMVGSVVVKDGRIVGEGFHEYFGGPHAEINALNEAKDKSKGATLYVTLEPCNHWGKTPPCTNTIIKAGISRVVAAMKDPDPRTAGKGFKKLENRGIRVTSGILGKNAAQLNAAYINAMKQRNSHVIAKVAMSLDGKIATKTGDSKWISSPASRAFVHHLRSRVDGILVGINTVIRDNPELTSHGRGKNPVRIIIDPTLKIPLPSRVLDNRAPSIIFYSKSMYPGKEEILKNKGILLARVLILNGEINFKLIIKKLKKMAIYRVLIEGGGETLATALNAGVVDEAFFFIAPILTGGRQAITPFEGPGIAKISDSLRLKSWRVKKMGKDLLIRGKLK